MSDWLQQQYELTLRYTNELQREIAELLPWLAPNMHRFYALKFVQNGAKPRPEQPPEHSNCRCQLPDSPFVEGDIVEECPHCDGWGYTPHNHD